MEKFKIIVSKGSKKYSLILSAENEAEVRDKIHKEGYTILNIEKFSSKITGNKFIFEAKKDGLKKRGIIIGNDIFKAYTKLRKDLKYNVDFLYYENEKDKNLEYKTKIIKELEEGYNKINADFEKKEQKKQEKIRGNDIKNKGNIDDFYLKKELENTHKLINLVIQKIDYFITKNNKISFEKKEKLKNIRNNIVKIKKSTNLFKLKQIGELALIKIGKIELELLEKEKTVEAKKYLKETNKLLKKIGSHKQIIEKQKDIKFILKKIVLKLKNKIKNKKIENRIKAYKAKKIDKESYDYLKTIVLLDKYKYRLKKNTLEILKNIDIIIFPFGSKKTKKEHLLIKRKVIKQNISILKAKKNGGAFSYTQIVNGYNKAIQNILNLIRNMLNYVFFVLLLFSFILILHYNITSYGYNKFNFNFLGLYYYIYILLFFVLINLSRGLITLIINVVIFSFIIIFGIVNF